MPRSMRAREQLSEEEKKKRRREQKKLSMRRTRAKMNEAEIEERKRKDRERYHKKKTQGRVKTIKDFTPREQRIIRKQWRIKAKERREKKKRQRAAAFFVDMNTPPSSPSTSRTLIGVAVRNRNRRLLKSENEKLRLKVINLNSKLAKYRMRLLRLNRGLENRPVKLVYTKSSNIKKSFENIRKRIYAFLFQDENSTLTSGKKETVTRKQIKKQIRLLNDSMINLHKKFVNTTGIRVSYDFFRKNRPFWVIFPKAGARNTCLCALHANCNFIVQALHTAKIVPYNSATHLVKAICCNDLLNVTCLERKCQECKEKKILTTDYTDDDTVSYERWITKNVQVVIKGQSKTCKKTMKERVFTTKKTLVDTLNTMLPVFLTHVANFIHQITAIKNLKQLMTPEEGLLHIDFSENYKCKYSQEIQSTHFGGSKNQISMHTCVFYYTNLEPPNNYVKTKSFCSISDNLNHDPILICVHLQGLVQKIKELSPKLTHLHILSDGPMTQYRNKSMFHLIATYLSIEFGVQTLTWHYSEKGHGKGAPDGVGGCLKRLCDSFVARGNDICNVDDMLSCLQKNCKAIDVYKIDETLVSRVGEIMSTSHTQPFKGTLKIHQLSWSVKSPLVLQVKRLSCLICAAHIRCPHYGIGEIQIKRSVLISPENQALSEALTEANLYRNATTVDTSKEPSSSKNSSMSERNLPENSPDVSIGPNSPETLGTSEASTVTVSPGLSDRLTPDNPTNTYVNHNCRPLKRQSFNWLFSDDSNSSNDIPFIKRRLIAPLVDYANESNTSNISENQAFDAKNNDTDDENIF